MTPLFSHGLSVQKRRSDSTSVSIPQEVESYYAGLEKQAGLSKLLKSASQYFDVCRSDCRMVPAGIQPTPVLLNFGGSSNQTAQLGSGNEGREGSVGLEDEDEGEDGGDENDGGDGVNHHADVFGLGDEGGEPAEFPRSSMWGKRGRSIQPATAPVMPSVEYSIVQPEPYPTRAVTPPAPIPTGAVTPPGWAAKTTNGEVGEPLQDLERHGGYCEEYEEGEGDGVLWECPFDDDHDPAGGDSARDCRGTAASLGGRAGINVDEWRAPTGCLSTGEFPAACWQGVGSSALGTLSGGVGNLLGGGGKFTPASTPMPRGRPDDDLTDVPLSIRMERLRSERRSSAGGWERQIMASKSKGHRPTSSCGVHEGGGKVTSGGGSEGRYGGGGRSIGRYSNSGGSVGITSLVSGSGYRDRPLTHRPSDGGHAEGGDRQGINDEDGSALIMGTQSGILLADRLEAAKQRLRRISGSTNSGGCVAGRGGRGRSLRGDLKPALQLAAAATGQWHNLDYSPPPPWGARHQPIVAGEKVWTRPQWSRMDTGQGPWSDHADAGAGSNIGSLGQGWDKAREEQQATDLPRDPSRAPLTHSGGLLDPPRGPPRPPEAEDALRAWEQQLYQIQTMDLHPQPKGRDKISDEGGWHEQVGSGDNGWGARKAGSRGNNVCLEPRPSHEGLEPAGPQVLPPSHQQVWAEQNPLPSSHNAARPLFVAPQLQPVIPWPQPGLSWSSSSIGGAEPTVVNETPFLMTAAEEDPVSIVPCTTDGVEVAALGDDSLNKPGHAEPSLAAARAPGALGVPVLVPAVVAGALPSPIFPKHLSFGASSHGPAAQVSNPNPAPAAVGGSGNGEKIDPAVFEFKFPALPMARHEPPLSSPIIITKACQSPPPPPPPSCIVLLSPEVIVRSELCSPKQGIKLEPDAVGSESRPLPGPGGPCRRRGAVLIDTPGSEGPPAAAIATLGGGRRQGAGHRRAVLDTPPSHEALMPEEKQQVLQPRAGRRVLMDTPETVELSDCEADPECRPHGRRVLIDSTPDSSAPSYVTSAEVGGGGGEGVSGSWGGFRAPGLEHITPTMKKKLQAGRNKGAAGGVAPVPTKRPGVAAGSGDGEGLWGPSLGVRSPRPQQGTGHEAKKRRQTVAPLPR